MKTCLLCSTEKSLNEFYKDARRKDGLGIYCKLCWKVKYHNPERSRKAAKDYHYRNRESLDYKEKRRYDQLKYLYGIDKVTYDLMILEQGSACAICKEDFGISVPQLDHDHNCCAGNKSCGKCRRGLLCTPCNQAIGLMQDNIVRLQSAASYLKEHSLA